MHWAAIGRDILQYLILLLVACSTYYEVVTRKQCTSRKVLLHFFTGNSFIASLLTILLCYFQYSLVLLVIVCYFKQLTTANIMQQEKRLAGVGGGFTLSLYIVGFLIYANLKAFTSCPL